MPAPRRRRCGVRRRAASRGEAGGPSPRRNGSRGHSLSLAWLMLTPGPRRFTQPVLGATGAQPERTLRRQAHIAIAAPMSPRVSSALAQQEDERDRVSRSACESGRGRVCILALVGSGAIAALGKRSDRVVGVLCVAASDSGAAVALRAVVWRMPPWCTGVSTVGRGALRDA